MSPFKRIARHARANVVAYLALFIALGGTSAYAANTIGSADIIDDSILTQDLKNAQVKSQDLATDAVGSAKILDNNILGSDIRNQTVTGSDIAPRAIGPAQLAPALAAQVHGVPETVQSGTSTVLHATSEQFDQGGLHNNDPDDNVFLYAPVSGIYVVTATVTWEADPGGYRFGVDPGAARRRAGLAAGGWRRRPDDAEPQRHLPDPRGRRIRQRDRGAEQRRPRSMRTSRSSR